jgi:PST family polysaccharide transporter
MLTIAPHHKKLVENILSLSVLQGANYLLPLLTLPYLVRVLGPYNFGLLAFAQAFMQYFIILTDYGFNLTATHDISICRSDSKRVSEIVCAVGFIKLFLLLLSFGIMAVIIYCFSKFSQDGLIFYCSFVAVIGNALFPIWFFQGIESMRSITVINIIAKIVTTILIFACVSNSTDTAATALIQSLGAVISGIIGIGVMLKKYPLLLLLPSRMLLIKTLYEGWYVFISTAAMSFYTASNMFILGILTTNEVVGYFSAADKVIKAVQGVLSPVSQAIYPHISALVVKSPEQALGFIRRCLVLLGSVAFILSLGLLVFADKIVLLVLGSTYGPSILLLRLMAFLPFIICLSNVLGIQTMLTFGLQAEFSKILIGAGLLNLVMIFPFTVIWSGAGTAVSLLITESIITIAMAIVLHRRGIKFIGAKGVS